MIVTTSSRTNGALIEKARMIADAVGSRFQLRGRDSIQDLQIAFMEEVLVVGKNRLELFLPHQEEPIFFHPNSAMFRIKRLMNGGYDPLIDACQLTEGMSFLDCTLGLGSDSIVASYAIGPNGRIHSIEGNRTIAYLVKIGLRTWDTGLPMMNMAMKAIDVKWAQYQEFLKQCEDKSFDVVYFDPMFEESIESSGLRGIKQIALYDDLTKEMVSEAKRVARKRIVLKDHWKSTRFESLGFNPIRRKSSNFHYAVIELG